MGNEKIAIGVLAGAIIAVAALLYFSLSGLPEKNPENNQQNYLQLSSKGNPDDVCAVPPGEDPKEWNEHLGHHPDQYAQCLK